MSKLSRKKLREILEEWFKGYESFVAEYGIEDEINYEEDNQALKQIMELIEGKK